jgi:hypothetical protein
MLTTTGALAAAPDPDCPREAIAADPPEFAACEGEADEAALAARASSSCPF